jgi:HPt (histidine-containing phosphotransfer) domain-containing protein
MLARWLSSKAIEASDSERTPQTCETANEQDEASNLLGLLQLSGFQEINCEQGLRHMMGKPDLYLKVLDRFRTGQADTGQQITRAIEENHLEQAKLLAHTLKGLSASIGAQKVHDAVIALELELNKEERDLFTSHCLSQLSDSLQQTLENVLEELNSLLPSLTKHLHRSSHEIEHSPEQSKSSLSGLIDLLENYSGECQSYFEQHQRSMLHLIDASTLEKLAKHIAQFEFDEAIKLIQT